MAASAFSTATPSMFVQAIGSCKGGRLLIDVMPKTGELMVHVRAWMMTMIFFRVVSLFVKFFRLRINRNGLFLGQRRQLQLFLLLYIDQIF